MPEVDMQDRAFTGKSHIEKERLLHIGDIFSEESMYKRGIFFYF